MGEIKVKDNGLSMWRWVASVSVGVVIALVSSIAGYFAGAWQIAKVEDQVVNQQSSGEVMEERVKNLSSIVYSNTGAIQELTKTTNENARRLERVDSNLRILMTSQGIRPK